MIIKKIARKNHLDCDKFIKYLIEEVGVDPDPDLKHYDLEDARVDEMVDGYHKFMANIENKEFPRERVKPSFRNNLQLIRRLKKINKRIEFLSKNPAKYEKDAMSYYKRVLEEQISNHLAKTPCEVLKKYKSGARIQPISQYSVLSLSKLSVNQIASMRGIGPKSAPAIKQCINTYMTEVRQNERIKLSSLNRTKAATSLLENLYLADKFNEISADGQQLKEKAVERNKQLIKKARPAAHPILFFLSGSKDSAFESIEIINVLLNSPLITEVEQLEEKRSAILKKTHDDYWDAFNNDPVRYYSILDDIRFHTHNTKKEQPATVYYQGLPLSLYEEIEKVNIDTNGLRCILRPYQRYGVKYILNQGNVLLGDEMGLGKTIEAIASIVSLRNNGGKYFVVICPASVLLNWEREIHKHSDLTCFILHGTEFNTNKSAWEEQGGIAIINYESVGKFQTNTKITLTVVDEAHYIKNSNAARTQNTMRVLALSERCLMMTGTPLENKLKEMLVLISMLRPDIANKASWLPQPIKPDAFKLTVAPVYFRRTKDAVWSEMPELQIIEDVVELTPAERQLYISCVREKTMSAFTKMRQVSFLVDDLDKSSKMKRIQDICEEAIANNRKVIIFSFYLDTISAIYDYLSEATDAVAFGPITGSSAPDSRQSMIDDFSENEGGAVLLAQILAGGTGLNIQSASIVILCEPQFKPSIENQAIARAYRMGQTSNVIVYRLLCSKTVDERILQMVKEKQAIFDAYADKSISGENSIQLKETDVAQAEFANSLIA
ncbi:MAG: DEAD/DEAH box helicase [Parasporobacterium sp.]|nr:DEAD/DEAH box helicase [Parasporobacterium sp.]